jgi:hypothetical protein
MRIMVKCPFCQFNNEDGALFCEQCKSDLSGVEPVGIPAAHPAGHEPIPVAAVMGGEPIPLASVEPFPSASPYPEAPIAQAFPVVEEPSTIPMVGMAVAEAAIHAGEAVTEAPTLPFATHEAPPAPPVVEAFPAELVAEPFPAAPVYEPPPAPPAPEPPPALVAEAAAAAGAAAVAAAAPAAPSPAPAAPPAAGEAAKLPAGAQPRLVVLRGQRINVEYPVYEGHNFIGRSDEKPVDIDLEDQEPPDRIWSSRQHALITYEDGGLMIEDLNSSNGTFVNRARIYPGQKTNLKVNDVVQIGTVQMKVKA